MKKVIVDENKCIGCGACVSIAEDTFDFNDNGLSEVINDEVNDAAIKACEACPVDAIRIEEKAN